MRSVFVSAVLAGVMGLSGVAFAATTTIGAIKSIDAKAMTVTLDDGVIYTLPAGFKVDSLKVGEKVSVMWDMKGLAHSASDVKAAS